MAQAFDKAAFRAKVAEAARSAAELIGVDLPGIGRCWVRGQTFGDEMEAAAARQHHEAAGVKLSASQHAAIRLAQNLCGPAGEPLFDIQNLEDLNLLAALPLEQVGAALSAAGEGASRAPKG